MSRLRAAYFATAALAAPLLRGMLVRRAAQGKEIPERLAERFGRAGLPRPAGRLIWLHAASLGETMSLLPVIEALRGQAQVLLTTGTVTSARLAAERLPEFARHQFTPLDVPRWVGRFLDHWQPAGAVFVESELWPATLLSLDAHGIPRLLLNGSLSARSLRRWRRVRPVARALLGGFAAVHAQTSRDAANLAALRSGAVLDWGDLKYAAPLLPVDPGALAAMQRLIPGPSWLAASTHPGEEEIVIAAHRALLPEFPKLVTIIAPRHPARGPAVTGLAPRLPSALRSRGETPVPGGLYIADTLGELGLFYRLSPFALVGGSLAPVGGHNLSEAARLGRPVLTGPHTAQVAEQIAALAAVDALFQITDAAGLALKVATLLRDPLAVQAAGARAARAFAGAQTLPARLAGLILANCR